MLTVARVYNVLLFLFASALFARRNGHPVGTDNYVSESVLYLPRPLRFSSVKPVQRTSTTSSAPPAHLLLTAQQRGRH